jgi:diguanylate cyclase (GGDEF)-like protein
VRRLSLTGTFAVVSVLTMALLAIALVAVFSSALKAQARSDGQLTAQTVVDTGVKRLVTSAADLTGRSPLADQANLLVDLTADQGTGPGLDFLRVYGQNGRLVYNSDAPDDVMRLADQATRTHVEGVLDGGSSAVIEDYQGEPSLVVYTPIVIGDQVQGVAEVGIPYASTQHRQQRALLVLALLIFGAFGIAWLLMFRTVHRASQRLREQAVENERLALHDPLTGLPNRRLLTDRLERAVLASSREGGVIALMILDVDRFKEVNDTLGHDRGDALLKLVADRLLDRVREVDTVARLGGDEFAVLAPGLHSVLDAERLARRIHTVFDRPFEIDQLMLHIDSSLGVAVMPGHADNAAELLQRADMAMYGAKQARLGTLLFQPEHDGASADRLVLLGDLRQALGGDQLQVYYQPTIDLQTNAVVGFEALLRWTHPERGPIPPGEFIPLAETTGMIHAITRYVLEEVVSQMAEWDHQRAPFAGLPVAVNLSARNLVEPTLAEFIEDLLGSFDLPADRLILEVTETALIEDPMRTRRMLEELSSLGVTLAVDDFGTGYTSMAQLEQMPLHTLKIDRSFVIRLMRDDGGTTLVRAIVELAHEFGLSVVAEGVEDEELTDHLRALGCDLAQGFLWSRPLPPSELLDVVVRLAAASENRSESRDRTPVPSGS